MAAKHFDIEQENQKLRKADAPLVLLGMIDEASHYSVVTPEIEGLFGEDDKRCH